jgi:hypothetical protein
MNFNFGEVLARAGEITWKHKSLWLAGIVISLIGMFPALISVIFAPSLFSFADPSEMNGQFPVVIWLINGLSILVSLLSIPLYAIGMAVPSLGTLQLEKGSEKLNLGELIKGTLPYFWRVLGVYLLVGLGGFLVAIVFMGCTGVLSVVTFGLASICGLVFFIPLGMLIFAFIEQGMAAILVDNLGVSSALQRAWELIKANLGVMALMSLIIYLGSMIVGMILSVPMMIPMFGYMNTMMQSMNAEPDFQAFEGLFRNMMWWMLAFSPLYAIFQGILIAFTQSAWTLTYLRLTKRQANIPAIIEANA